MLGSKWSRTTLHCIPIRFLPCLSSCSLRQCPNNSSLNVHHSIDKFKTEVCQESQLRCLLNYFQKLCKPKLISWLWKYISHLSANTMDLSTGRPGTLPIFLFFFVFHGTTRAEVKCSLINQIPLNLAPWLKTRNRPSRFSHPPPPIKIIKTQPWSPRNQGVLKIFKKRKKKVNDPTTREQLYKGKFGGKIQL